METPSAEDEELPSELKLKFDRCISDPLFKRTSQKLIEAVYNTFQQSGPLEKSKTSDVYSTFGTKTWKLRTQDGTVKIESTSGSFEHKETGDCDVLRMSDIRCLECSAFEKYIDCHITALPCTTAEEVERFFRYLLPRVPDAFTLPATAPRLSTSSDDQDNEPRLCNRLIVELKNERTSREAAEAQYRQVVQLIEGARFDVPKKMDSQVNTDPDPTAAEAKELRKELKQLRERLREADSHCAEAERKRKDAAEGHQHAITELAAFRNAYQDLSNKNHDLDEQVTRLKAVNKEQKNKLRAFESAKQIIQEKKACGANSKSEGCKKRCRHISLDPIHTDVERIRSQNDDLKATVRCLQKKNSDLERSLAAESARVNELKRTLECTQRKSGKLVAAASQQKDALIHKVEVLQQDNRNLAEMLAKASARAEECGALQEQLQRAQDMNDDLREELRQTVQRATSSRVRAILLEKELEGHNSAVPDLERKIAQLEDDLKQTEQRASSSEIQAALRLSALTERRKQLEDANRVIERLQNSAAQAELQQRATSAEVRAILLESAHRKEMESVKQHVERLEAKLMARNDLVAELSIKLRSVSGALGDPSRHDKNEPTETPV